MAKSKVSKTKELQGVQPGSVSSVWLVMGLFKIAVFGVLASAIKCLSQAPACIAIKHTHTHTHTHTTFRCLCREEAAEEQASR